MKSDNFDLIEQLGKGSYSKVFKVRRKDDGKIYALKKVNLGPISEKEKVNSLNEVWLLSLLNHPNIINYKETFIEDNVLYIVIEFADNLDLY